MKVKSVLLILMASQIIAYCQRFFHRFSKTIPQYSKGGNYPKISEDVPKVSEDAPKISGSQSQEEFRQITFATSNLNFSSKIGKKEEVLSATREKLVFDP